MKKSIFLCAWALLLGMVMQNAAASSAKLMPDYPENSRNLVYIVPQFSEFEEISDSEMHFFKQVLERAADARAKAVILELDTPGGSVGTAFKYLSMMERSAIPIVVYLNPNGISAGMIIALGANRVAITPNGIIGDAMPLEMGLGGARPVTDRPDDKPAPAPAQVEKTQPEKSPEKVESEGIERILKELKGIKKDDNKLTEEEKKLADQKFLTVFFKILQVLAEKNNRPVNVVRAMADPYQKLEEARDGISHDKVSPLTLSAKEALKLGVVDMIAADRAELLKQLGLADAEVAIIERNATEQIGAFLATPALAGLLLVLGLIGIFVEIKTPGFGVPGVLGIAALTLFFLGHIASGASNWGPMVVFFVGLLLLALEIFVIPGFGLVGILGIGCILLSFFWSFGFANIETAVRVVTISLLCAIAAMVLLAVYVLPKSSLFKRVSLDTQMTAQEGFTAEHADTGLVGKTGVTLTPLRPAGMVEIEGKRHDASSEGDYLDAGVEVKVTAVNGFQIVVRRA